MCNERAVSGLLGRSYGPYTATTAISQQQGTEVKTTCNKTCTASRHSPTCRSRASLTSGEREGGGGEDTPAYMSDELGLSEADKAGVENVARTEIRDDAGNVIGRLGAATVDELMRCVRRHGKVAGIIESALALPLFEYRAVEDAWRKAPTP